ncbi:MAG: hypothetical protein SH868_02735 [Bythopirellula sp.]|nr:hypothetical protein [Bythopirellula sp.]
MNVVLLSRDLMLLSRAQGAANKQGITLHNVVDPAQAVTAAQTEEYRGVVIDLRLPGLNISELVSQLRAVRDKFWIVACGPHVHEASLSAAREAGCDIVATRGQFDRDAEAILQRCVNSEGS